MNGSKFIEHFRRHKEGVNIDQLKGAHNVNLGCGNKPLAGFINTDFYNRKYADRVFNLENDFPFSDGSVDLIYADNVFEHLQNFLDVVNRCFAALKPDGYLIIKAPYFKSKHAFVDPTHIRFFTIQTLDYFVRGTYFNNQYGFGGESFNQISIFLDPEENSFFGNLVATYAIRQPNHFENSIFSSMVVFHNITFVLKK